MGRGHTNSNSMSDSSFLFLCSGGTAVSFLIPEEQSSDSSMDPPFVVIEARLAGLPQCPVPSSILAQLIVTPLRFGIFCLPVSSGSQLQMSLAAHFSWAVPFIHTFSPVTWASASL